MDFVPGLRRAIFVVASVLVTSLISKEAAATPSAQLVYMRGPGAEQCPDRAALRKAVAARLGFDPFFPYARQTLVAEIAPAKRGFRGRFQVLDETGVIRGERVLDFETSDCFEMLGVMALGISIAIDYLDIDTPEATASSTPPPSLPSAAAPPPPPLVAPPLVAPPLDDAGPELSPERARSPKPASARFSYDLRAGAAGSVGTAPTAAFGGTVAAGARWRAVGLLLEGHFQPRVTSAAAGGGSVWSTLMVGTAAACLHGAIPYACALASVGSFRGGGENIASPQSGSAFYGAAGARLGAQLAVYESIYAYGQLDVAYTLTPAKVVIDDRVVFALSTLTGAAGVGGGVRF